LQKLNAYLYLSFVSSIEREATAAGFINSSLVITAATVITGWGFEVAVELIAIMTVVVSR